MSVLDKELIEKEPDELERRDLEAYYDYLMDQKERISIEIDSTRKRIRLSERRSALLERKLSGEKRAKVKLSRQEVSHLEDHTQYSKEVEDELEHLRGHMEDFDDRLGTVNELIAECKKLNADLR